MESELRRSISRRYAISIAEAHPAHRQFVAETFTLITGDNRRFFCKVIRKPAFVEAAVKSLPVLNELRRSGIPNISAPVRTVDGALYCTAKSSTVIVFDWIDAEQTFDFDRRVLGEIIAAVHGTRPAPSIPIAHEEFLFLYCDLFPERLAEALSPAGPDPVRVELRELLEVYREEIEQDWRGFLQLARRLTALDPAMVITHGDAPGNVLVGNGNQHYLVDWDDVMLAPVERDLWFLVDDAEFTAGYRSRFPDISINDDLVAYYALTRYFADMFEFIDEILAEHPRQHRQRNLDALRDDCFVKWLRPFIRRFMTC